MSGLINAGITKKKQWQIFSSFGRMVFGAQKLIGKAQHSSKLESIGCIPRPEFATAGCSKHDYLINTAEIEEILVRPQHYNNYFFTEKEKRYTNELQPQQNPQLCNSTHESGHNDKRSRSQTTQHQIYRIRLGYILLRTSMIADINEDTFCECVSSTRGTL